MRAIGLRLVALPMFAFAFFVAYTHSLPFAESLLPTADKVGIGLFIAACGVLAVTLAVVWGLVFALPLAWLYRRHAVLVAAGCVAPLLIVIGVGYFNRHTPSAVAHLPIVFLVVSLVTIVPGAAHVMYRLMRSHNNYVA